MPILVIYADGLDLERAKVGIWSLVSLVRPPSAVAKAELSRPLEHRLRPDPQTVAKHLTDPRLDVRETQRA